MFQYHFLSSDKNRQQRKFAFLSLCQLDGQQKVVCDFLNNSQNTYLPDAFFSNFSSDHSAGGKGCSLLCRSGRKEISNPCWNFCFLKFEQKVHASLAFSVAIHVRRSGKLCTAFNPIESICTIKPLAGGKPMAEKRL